VEVLASENEIGMLLEYAKSNLTENKEIKEAFTTLVLVLVDLKREIQEKNVYIEFLTAREKERERREVACNERLQKRRLAQKKPQLDTISHSDFLELQDLIPEIYPNRLICARVKFLLALLYITGMRVSNPLLLTTQNMKDLFTTGSVLY
jgi:integrase